jgi:hypothetical protein
MTTFVLWLIHIVFLMATAFGYVGVNWYPSIDSESKISNFERQLKNYQADAPTETVVFNLPVIENNSQNSTPSPLDNYPPPGLVTEIPLITPTPTPTPIPVQTGTVNLPIVIGATAIIVVILFAWFFVGFLPSRIKPKPN